MKKFMIGFSILLITACTVFGDQYLTPSTSDLRLRTEPSTKGKMIRLLRKGEKLVLVEKGNSETVGGSQGNWVKVQTTGNETGWCFDRFLENYKAPALSSYSNPEFRIRFSYPSSWGKAQAEKYPKSDMLAVDETDVTFEGLKQGYEIRSVVLTRLSSYGADCKAAIDNIKKVYSQRNVNGVPVILLPPPNAGVAAHTSPRYIENAGGSFRGMYYFASIGQDVASYVDSMIILFNGRDDIVTIHISRLSDNPAYSFQKIQNEKTFQAFKTHIKNLTETSPETTAREFNEIYKEIARSVEKY